MSRKLNNYLRTYRRRNGLSQDEVAFLLKCEDGSKVSRYEHFVRQPSLETALAREAIFGVPVHELFAGLYQKVEEQTIRRARTLTQRLAQKNSCRQREQKEALLKVICCGRALNNISAK